jgi:ribosome-binding ATPase
MEIGLVGKPNVGKSTLFKALTLAEAEIANFPFTTIDANIGVGYVRSKCPCAEFKLSCNPRNSLCRRGARYTPVKLIDVAGLVPGAHQGKGMGNKFLDDLRQADVLIHVVDISGRTNENGEETQCHDPEKDIKFLEDEIDLWFASIVKKNWSSVRGKIRCSGTKIVHELAEVMAGLGVREHHIKSAIHNSGLEGKIEWSEGDCEKFGFELRRISKPIVIAANKIDGGAPEFNRLNKEYDLVAVCAEAELALKEADKNKLIEYIPGDGSFKVFGELDDKRRNALSYIDSKILKVYGSTGAQEILDKAASSLLGLITVFPVENESKLTDGKGMVLPDSHLMPNGSTVLDLAYRIHTDLGGKFIGAIDCRTKMKVGKDHKLKDCDIIKIIAGK